MPVAPRPAAATELENGFLFQCFRGSGSPLYTQLLSTAVHADADLARESPMSVTACGREVCASRHNPGEMRVVTLVRKAVSAPVGVSGLAPARRCSPQPLLPPQGSALPHTLFCPPKALHTAAGPWSKACPFPRPPPSLPTLLPASWLGCIQPGSPPVLGPALGVERSVISQGCRARSCFPVSSRWGQRQNECKQSIKRVCTHMPA